MSSEPTRQQVLELHNQMFISPQDFSYRWGLDYEQLARICCLSKSTTYHWLGGQASRRQAGLPYQRIMAVADVLLENAEQVYPLNLCYKMASKSDILMAVSSSSVKESGFDGNPIA